MTPRAIPRWQTRLLQICLTLIVVAACSALAIAPSVLRRNMETVDTSALRSELFDLHLGIDAFRVAVVEWQDALLRGAAETTRRCSSRNAASCCCTGWASFWRIRG